MEHRMRKHFGATPAEALWRDVCGGAVRDPSGSTLARFLRTLSAATTAEALWRDACGGALARRLRRRYGARPAEGL